MGFIPTVAGFIGLTLSRNHAAGQFTYLLIIPALVVPYAVSAWITVELRSPEMSQARRNTARSRA